MCWAACPSPSLCDRAPLPVVWAMPQAIPPAVDRLNPFRFVAQCYARLAMKVRFLLQAPESVKTLVQLARSWAISR